MSGKLVAVIVALCVVAAGAAAIIILTKQQSEGGEYRITYDLNGGSSNNPSTYDSSKGLILEDATHPYLTFSGWFDDSGKKVTSIPSGTKGDIHLTAEFISNFGKELTYSVTGTTYFGVATGNATLTYIKDDGQKYLVDLEAIYSDGTETAVISECLALTDSMDGYEVYFDNERLPVTIAWNHVYGRMTLTMTSSKDVHVKERVMISATSDGITIEGSGTYDVGNRFVLIPEVDERLYRVDGWYLDGEKVSGSFRLECDHAYRDCAYTFKAKEMEGLKEATDVGEVYTLKPDTSIITGTWSIIDKSIGESIIEFPIDGTIPTYIFTEAGIYTIKEIGKDADGNDRSYSYDILVDDILPKTFEWTFKDKKYEMTVDIPYHIYYSYSSDTSVPRKQDKKDISNNTVYVTYFDPVVLDASSKLYEMAKKEGFGPKDTAGLVLAFVQYIKYTSDDKGEEGREYWNYAVETLFEQHGDCEDTSMLFCAILKPLGYKVSELVFNFPGHMAAGLALTDGDLGFVLFPKDSVNYYFCETSEERYIGYVIGQRPGGESSVFTPNGATIYTIQ